MNGRTAVGSVAMGLVTTLAVAGGRPEQVTFPADYATAFRNYVITNRASGKPEIAKVFANDVAQQSAAAGGPLAPGSILVMEIHKAALNEAGEPVAGEGGVYTPVALAAIAVMEKRTEWPAAYPEAERAGGWGFALYGPDGKPKENDLVCNGCHLPYAAQDYLFTRAQLDAAVK
jgi:hypothetical protein